MSSRSSTQSPFSYIRHRRAIRDAAKPTVIEKITSRRYINPQAASPLFALLPAEIRQQIFQFALLSYTNPARPYSQHSFWYRPEFTHAKAIAIGLLLTCRRIYLETHSLALIQNEHVIWGVERSRIPPHASNYLVNGSMRTPQRNAIQCVHLFTQQFWLEDWKFKWLAYTQSWPDGCPPKLKITIRHTDWWYNLLGENSPLALDPKRKGRAKVADWVDEKQPFEPGSWGQRFVYLKGLRQFDLELETVETKKGELDAIASRASTWKFPLGDNKILMPDEKATKTVRWTGSKHFKGLNTPGVPSGLQLRQGSTASFPALNRRRANTEPEILESSDMLNYYVLALTWRAQNLPNNSDVIEKEELGIAQPVLGPSPTTPAVPFATPRVSYNRMNALPTFYG